MPIANRLFTNAHIRTMAPAGPAAHTPTAGALASWRGRIVAVGDPDDVDALVGPDTEVVDLGGATVLPGFIETHMHPLGAGVQKAAPQIGYPDCRSIEDVVVALAERAAITPAGQPIQAFGYDDSLMAEDRHLTRHDLDRASIDHPVYLRHVSGHLGYANSRTLELAGVTNEVEDPVGGHFQRDEAGRITGCMEESANFAVGSALPLADSATLRAGAKVINDHCLSVGATTMTDAGVGTESMVATYQDAIDDGTIRVRTRLFPVWRLADGFPTRTGMGDDRLSVGAMKFFSDGSIQGYTACLCKGYHDRPDVNGYPFIPPDEMTEMITDSHARGWQVAVHANGDAAIDNTLDAFEAALTAHPRADHRHRIEHCQVVREDQLERMARLGVLASVFVNHVWYWGDRHRDRFLGPERGARIDPLASLRAHGIVHALHCDMPVTPLDPLFTIWTAVNRVTRDGELLGPEQRARVEDAVAGYTSAAAFVNRQEHDRGTLEVGKLADLVVLDDDPFTVDPMAIRDINVQATVVGGEFEYQT
ncbi:MAG: amidohydrolase [Actinomycetota bacterium]|nr:amidohydrolase [Actinomycetota bacterium]MED6328627.1 amidohydrolase [Actinomycetota bacterium]MEE2957547.1 amidohydrolase [Actinomycetota bacterium]